MKTLNIKFLLFIMIPIYMGCDGYLDQKPRQSYVLPESIADFQALMDNTTQVFNFSPGGFVFASDELNITPQGYNALILTAREFYSWDPDSFFASENIGDWNRPYQQIFVSNLVLEGLEKFSQAERDQQWNHLHGQALFSRAYAMYNLLQLFADAYTPANAPNSFGLPYPTSSNINLRPQRETLQITYQKVVDDLLKSAEYLPEEIAHLTRPSKPAAYLMLAKTYLILSEFQHAEEYAELSYNLKNDLLDYNTLNPDLSRPIPIFNSEQIYYTVQLSISQFSNQIYFEEDFFDSYNENDLRKEVFFQNNPSSGLLNFKGSYTGNFNFFGGLAVDETVFVLAEAKIRNGKLDEASDLVNDFLKFRFKDGIISPIDFNAENDPIQKLFEEKQKQLVFRGTRWTDIRRLMAEEKISETLIKTVGEEAFTLIPGEKKWTYLIPFSETSRNDIPQNPR